MLVDDLVNSKLDNGRYLVKSKLGEGGMGTVYLGHDTRLDSAVVVKVPHRAMLTEPGFRDRFQREIQSLVKLMHPHVVKVIDVGEHEKIPFAVMQHLGGGSLSEMRKRGQYSLSKLGDWLVPIAKALDFIHEKNYIHRDVKPANILFDEVGNAFLGDFGIAKVAAESEEKKRQKSLTGTGIAMGTPEYMAPELCDGRSIDKRVDQYALGVTVYEFLAGRCPLIGATPLATIFMHKTHQPDALCELNPDITRDVSDLVQKAMSKERDDRFESCLEFADALLGLGISGRRPKSTSSESGTFPSNADDTDSQNVTDLLVEVGPTEPVDGALDGGKTDASSRDATSPQTAPPPLPLADQSDRRESLNPRAPATAQRANAKTTPHQDSKSASPDSGQQRRDPCPSCGKSLRVPPQLKGRIVVCPNCNTKLTIQNFGLKELSGPQTLPRPAQGPAPANRPQTESGQVGSAQAGSAQTGSAQTKNSAQTESAKADSELEKPAKPELPQQQPTPHPKPAPLPKPKKESSTPKWVVWFWILFIFFGGIGSWLVYAISSQNEQNKQTLRDDVAAWERSYILEDSTQKYLERNVDSKLTFWKRHAEKGDPNAQVLYGDCFEMGIGVEEKDLIKATSWYQRSANQKNAAGMWALGSMYHEGKGVQRDQQKGVKLFRQAAESGYSSAQYSLARSYYYGYGVKESKKDGIYWYNKAADNGNADAQYRLGYMYHFGLGVTKDYKQALEWYRTSANSGSSEGMYRVGYLYESGLGVKKDDQEAFSWFLKAAQKGYATAQNHVGIFYRTGRGVKKDEAAALKWYRQAAAQGNSIGLYNVGICYEFGYGVEADKQKAIEWYEKSAAKGYQSAKDRLKKLKPSKSP